MVNFGDDNYKATPRAVLGDGFLRHFGSEEWTLIDVDATPRQVIVALALPLTDEFTAIAELYGTETGARGRCPVDLFALKVGVAYEPLRRLWTLLGSRFALSSVSENADELAGRPRKWPESLANATQAAQVADELAPLVGATASNFAQDYLNIDALLDGHHGGVLMKAALLAATGRFDEAAEVLVEFKVVDNIRPVHRREQERTAYQLRRFVEARGDPSLVPDQPPPNPETRPPIPIEDWLPRATVDQGKKVAAIGAVKRRSRGKNREEVRADLAGEFERRGLNESSLSLERAVEQIMGPSRTWRSRVNAFRSGASAMSDITRRVKNAEGVVPRPEWLSPPVEAAYRVPARPDDVWDEVELDSDGAAWLREVYEQVPRMGDVLSAEAWLDAAGDDESGEISAHVGHNRVGVIAPGVGSGYHDLLRDAASRAELPCLAARLSERQGGGVLLEIRRPCDENGWRKG